MYDLRDREFLGKLNSATKYPETPTYHTMDKKSGLLEEHEVIDFTDNKVQVTEKLDGTNGRIVVLPGSPAERGVVHDPAQWVIGSREELLSCSHDIMINPLLGIVDALNKTAWDLAEHHYNEDIPGVRVYFFEVFGGNVGSNSRQYTKDKEQFGHRLFDVIEFSPELFEETMSRDREAIAGWRNRGNQPFMGWDDFLRVTQETNVQRVPILTARMDGGLLPRTFGESVKFLTDCKSTAKMRFQDYYSTIRRRKEAMDSIAKQRLRDTVVE